MHTSKKTRQNIIETAIRLFSEKGYENVSIKDICGEIGFGRSTFYYHFRTKEQIIAEYYNSDLVYSSENMSWILTAPTNFERALRIQLAYENHIASIGSDDAISKFLVSGLMSNNNAFLASFDKVRAMLIPVIEQCQETGEIKNKMDSEKICDLAMEIQSGIIFQYFFIGKRFDRVEKLRESLSNLYNNAII